MKLLFSPFRICRVMTIYILGEKIFKYVQSQYQSRDLFNEIHAQSDNISYIISKQDFKLALG